MVMIASALNTSVALIFLVAINYFLNVFVNALIIFQREKLPRCPSDESDEAKSASRSVPRTALPEGQPVFGCHYSTSI